MLTSYHNHSHWSDGRGSVASMLHEAARIGLDELGISDHLVLDPHDFPPGWSMPRARVPEYLAALSDAREAAPSRLRIGIEIDWIPGQQPAIAAVLDDPRWDYVIGSVHQVMGLHVDSAVDQLLRLGPQALDTLNQRYWALVRDMAISRMFDVAAHLDLPKKLLGRPQAAKERGVRTGGFAAVQHRPGFPHVGDAPNIPAALDAIADAGMVVELNTAGWDMPCRECYPSPKILAACYDRSIPVTINADAHSVRDLLRHFDLAVRVLRQVGYREVMRLDGRQAHPQPLDDFEAALRRP